MINALYYKTPKELEKAFKTTCSTHSTNPCIECPVYRWMKEHKNTKIDCKFVFAMIDHEKSERKVEKK